jgi:NAD(P)-dependent dehydrogenase (short-subunit alcohol dehydrogenase family)
MAVADAGRARESARQSVTEEQMAMLDGKVAVVTGAGRGIGRAEAMLLASHGARVVVNDLGGSLFGDGDDRSPARSVVDEIRAAGGEAVANTDDIGEWDGAKGLIAQAITTYGDLDIVVNNAGVIRTKMSFNTDESDWDVVIKVHLKGTFCTSRFAGEHWRDKAKQSGRLTSAAIVNTSSPNGLNGGVPGHVNYAAAKSGIATMTITFARELEPYGVRVNAIAPVAFTRMTESLWGDGLFSEDKREELSPDGIASVVTWLASPLAHDVSGQVLGIQGTECFVWESWRAGAPVDNHGRAWTVDALDAASGKLFDARSRGIPPVGRGG